MCQIEIIKSKLCDVYVLSVSIERISDSQFVPFFFHSALLPTSIWTVCWSTTWNPWRKRPSWATLKSTRFSATSKKSCSSSGSFCRASRKQSLQNLNSTNLKRPLSSRWAYYLKWKWLQIKQLNVKYDHAYSG